MDARATRHSFHLEKQRNTRGGRETKEHSYHLEKQRNTSRGGTILYPVPRGPKGDKEAGWVGASRGLQRWFACLFLTKFHVWHVIWMSV